MDANLLAALRGIMFSSTATEGDVERWHSSGLRCNQDKNCFGLVQRFGGPCGVLAAVQAEMIRQFIFEDKRDIVNVTPSEATRGIVLALSLVRPQPAQARLS